jgi:orotidine-5'-phosphate decarboxylase
MIPAQRLIVALDVPTVEDALDLVNHLSPVVSIFKIGYWLMFDPGLHFLVPVLRARQKQIFLDAKLNDIPETVRRGVESAARWADFITVHSDESMLVAAMAGKGDSPIKIMAVTELTSRPAVGNRHQFHAGMMNAIFADCDGLIMSPSDLRIYEKFRGQEKSRNRLVATPGVRMAGESSNDHSRSGTPAQAIQDGADWIIVGRPIIRAADPRAEAEKFISQIEQGAGLAPAP